MPLRHHPSSGFVYQASSPGCLPTGTAWSEPIPVTPGGEYDLGGFVRGELDPDDSKGYWALRAEFYPSDRAFLSYPDAGNRPAGTLNGAWHPYRGQA